MMEDLFFSENIFILRETSSVNLNSMEKKLAEGEVRRLLNRFKPPSNFLLTVPRRHFCCGSDLFVIIFIVLLIA